MDGVAAEVHLASPRVHLPGNVQCRFTDLHADDLFVADSPIGPSDRPEYRSPTGVLVPHLPDLDVITQMPVVLCAWKNVSHDPNGFCIVVNLSNSHNSLIRTFFTSTIDVS